MRHNMLLASLLLTACSQTQEPNLNGYWVTFDEVYNCVNLVLLNKDKTYSMATSCILDDGSEAMEVDKGTYEVTAKEITFLPKEGSCSSAIKPTEVLNYPFTLKYHFPTDDQLALQNNEGGGVFDHVDVNDFKSGSAVTFGCFRDNGTFVPSPVQPY